MPEKEEFMNFALHELEYKTKEDLYENLYLRAFIDTYRRIDKTSVLENEIRDKFVFDFEKVNPLTKDLIRKQILILTWERWLNVSEEEQRRADICFSMSGFEFIIECKRLKFADSKYLNHGVKRFVRLKYGKYDTHAGMIGFVTGGDIGKIAANLKPKVRDFYFSPGFEYLLRKRCLDWEHSFQSCHHRENNTHIHLYHMFFNFVPGN
ncbi:MAG: hypothetical protein GY950_13755 [bacterium]|nr:hypothetical protein [bacterium]